MKLWGPTSAPALAPILALLTGAALFFGGCTPMPVSGPIEGPTPAPQDAGSASPLATPAAEAAATEDAATEDAATEDAATEDAATEDAAAEDAAAEEAATASPAAEPGATEPAPPVEEQAMPADPNLAGIPGDLLNAVLEDAAQRLDVAADAIVVTRAEAVTWNDGSLGCPEPGMFYTQALVDGYQIVVEAETEDGPQSLDYRTQGSSFFRVCDRPGPGSRLRP